jgi:hypothetical protein
MPHEAGWYEHHDREGNPLKGVRGKRALMPFFRFHDDAREGLTQERRTEKNKSTGTKNLLTLAECRGLPEIRSKASGGPIKNVTPK